MPLSSLMSPHYIFNWVLLVGFVYGFLYLINSKVLDFPETNHGKNSNKNNTSGNKHLYCSITPSRPCVLWDRDEAPCRMMLLIPLQLSGRVWGHTVPESVCILKAPGLLFPCYELLPPMGVGGREAQEGGSICILIADSHWCTAESNTTL